MNARRFSWTRWISIVIKEFIQLKRDRLTFGMIVGIPVIQVLLFGFAINSDPKSLPTAVVSLDNGRYTRTIVSALANTGYFRFVHEPASMEEADRMIERGKVQFVVTIPAGFERALVRGDRPQLLIEADATDPSATGNALAAVNQALTTALAHDFQGVTGELTVGTVAVDVRIQRRYNPEGITAYNIVPGLLGVILTMTMVLMTGLAMTRERERGTFENLLSTPALPVEVMTGKIIPYILIGLIQVTLALLAARYIFSVPIEGSIVLLYGVVLVFIAANLTLGITFSSIARNQLQAMQMTFFFFLPSILLSGFMFPFRGMPEWAQAIGSLLPLTHFLVLVRGILLKGTSLHELYSSIWPIFAFMGAILLLGLKFYRKTLD